MLIELLIGSVAVGFIIYKFTVRPYDYWKKQGIPYIEPSFPFGNTKDFILGKEFGGTFFGDMYFKYKGEKYVGFTNLRIPTLLLNDPEIIKQVMTKDFHNYTDHGEPVQGILLQHLFNLRGDKWKSLRHKLTPTFTSGKIKLMFQLMKVCADRLGESLEKYAENDSVINIKDLLARFTTDVIGSCAFGLEIDSINNPDNPFRKKTGDLFKVNLRVLLWSLLNFIIPELTTKIGFFAMSQDVEDFFVNMVKDTVEYRKKNNVVRNDFLDLLIQIQEKGKLDDHDEDHDSGNPLEKNMARAGNEQPLKKDDIYLTDELMTAQCFVFFIAGFETSSTTMSFCLHELAINTDIQVKLRDEIDRVLGKHDGKITYDALKEMTYMDKVISETLRKYPPLPFLTRECTNDNLLDGKIAMKKGDFVYIPLFGLHYDPQYWPDPDKFDPERFSEEEKGSRHHYTYLPFGEGPRICIGMRFGIAQVKTGLASVLSKYEVSRAPETKHPLEFSKRNIITSTDEGIIVRISKRSK